MCIRKVKASWQPVMLVANNSFLGCANLISATNNTRPHLHRRSHRLFASYFAVKKVWNIDKCLLCQKQSVWSPRRILQSFFQVPLMSVVTPTDILELRWNRYIVVMNSQRWKIISVVEQLAQKGSHNFPVRIWDMPIDLEGSQKDCHTKRKLSATWNIV